MKSQSRIIRPYFVFLIISILPFIVISGCIPNSDVYKELSGDYFYRDEAAHVKDIICHLPNRKNIYSEVIGYDYDADFIVAAQNPIYSDYKQMVGGELRISKKKYHANSSEDLIQSEKEADSILKHDAFYKSIFIHNLNYWIISNKTKVLYGPFTKSEYENKRKALNVPEDIQIDYNQ